jgi:hypothetical protein
VSAALALRAAVRSKLVDDAALSGLLGGAKIFDEVPASAGAPYIVLADIESREAGSSHEEGEEHRFTLNIWSREGGLGEALNAAAQVASSLDGADIPLTGHRLANLRWLATDARRASDGRHRMASLRFRALTEPEE